jgi:UDP-glucose 4-epimerase
MTAVVHAGRDPLLGKPGYRPENDAEIALARLAAAQGLPFLSLGTRKVYAPSGDPLAEAAPLGPTDRYGEHKLALEEALDAILGQHLTRLRLANIFGFELGRQGFMGMMLAALERGDPITFDMSPFVRRDFLPSRPPPQRSPASPTSHPAASSISAPASASRPAVSPWP